MKRLIIVSLAIALFSMSAMAQTEKFIEKFAGNANITYVNISEAMMGLMSPESLEGMTVNSSLNMGDMMSGLKRLCVLTTEDPGTIEAMQKEVNKAIKKNHVSLMQVRDQETKVDFYGIITKSKLKDILMIVQEPSEMTIIYFKGSFDKNIIKQLSQQNE
ncbi:DUF4252 domain-containing protein [Gammaproteobacteria bacterium]|nr:DUF4252 domain-containing protein [Gammaproteobacteria bacterium]